MKSPLKDTSTDIGNVTYSSGNINYDLTGQGFNLESPTINEERGVIGSSDMYDSDLSNTYQGSLTETTSLGGGGMGGGTGSSSMPQFSQAAGDSAGMIGAGVGNVMQGLIGRKKRRRAQREAQRAYDQMLQQYRDLDTSNLYADVENPFAENVYEDLTVNQQQAQFEKQMFEQQQANILQGLSGAAGGSGIAGLAQALSMQGERARQRASATIGQQEAANQRLRAQGALQVQKGEAMAQQMRLSGAEQARGLEYQKTSTLFGMEQQNLAAANQAVAAGEAALYGGLGQIAGGGIGMSTEAAQMVAQTASDRKLKKNINLIGRSSSGLNIYSFEYIDSKYGNGVFQGVMADEIPSAAVHNKNGYDMVNYNMIDVEFKRIN